MTSVMSAIPSVHASMLSLCDAMDLMHNNFLQRTCRGVLCDYRFLEAPGSHEKHHAYRYGLLIHTAEVTAIAVQSARIFPQVDYNVLVTAAIFHDFNKIFDYTIDDTGKIEKTRYRYLVRHLAGSHATFLQSVANATEDQVSRETVMMIEHAMLAHHGRFEWGSPVEPQTLEAHLLHNADVLSYKYGAKTISDPPLITLK